MLQHWNTHNWFILQIIKRKMYCREKMDRWHSRDSIPRDRKHGKASQRDAKDPDGPPLESNWQPRREQNVYAEHVDSVGPISDPRPRQHGRKPNSKLKQRKQRYFPALKVLHVSENASAQRRTTRESFISCLAAYI